MTFMKTFRLFLRGLSFIIVLCGMTAENGLATTDPEYYLSTSAACIQLAVPTWCYQGPPSCVVTVNATQVNRPVYDARTAAGQCQSQLSQD